MTRKEALDLDQSNNKAAIITTLWQFARCHYDYATKTAANKYNKCTNSLPHILLKLQGKELNVTLTAKKYNEARTRMSIGNNFDRRTPGA